jgi:hypothetical protein
MLRVDTPFRYNHRSTASTLRALPHLGQLGPHRPDARQHLAAGQIAVAHHSAPARLIEPPGVALEKALQLRTHRLADQLLRALAQELHQWIDNLIFLPKLNYRILTHGRVTPFMDTEIDFDNRIPASHAAFFNSGPYTSFDHSSVFDRSGLKHLAVEDRLVQKQ